jgi:predicted ribosome quality control (RQC) complex YloA/Tae2 family protein
VDEAPENPERPPAFCMVLRKHLSAARITDISQHGDERILEVFLETVDELGFNVNRKLIIEIMGKHSNVLLVDMQTEKIIDSIKHVSIDVNRARQILPGKLYEYPPSQNKIPFTEVTEEQFRSLIEGQLQPERSLLNGIQGISPSLAYTLASGVTTLPFLTNSIDRGCITPLVYLDKDNKPADFHITELTSYEEDERFRRISFDTVSEAAAYYFINRESSNTIRQKSNDLARVVRGHTDKLKLKIQRLNEDLQKAENADKYRLCGELLTANLHLVKPGMDRIRVTSYYDGNDVDIPLDPRYTPAGNAQNYYKKYGKYKTAIKEKQIQLDETYADIDYLESVITFIERAASIEEINLLRSELVESGFIRFRRSDKKAGQKGTKKEKHAPHSYTLKSGKKVLVGRNNKENDWLTFKKASPNDIWLHTKDIPGSHVILFTDGTEPTEEDLFEAAGIAAHHSKASASQNVPVDYVKVRHVKKPSGAKPGFVIFTKNRTLYV